VRYASSTKHRDRRHFTVEPPNRVSSDSWDVRLVSDMKDTLWSVIMVRRHKFKIGPRRDRQRDSDTCAGDSDKLTLPHTHLQEASAHALTPMA